MPDELRAVDRIYIEAKLFPNYLAPTYYPEALLGYIGAVPVGSRSDASILRTAAQDRPSGTRRLILAVDDTALERLESLVDAPGPGRSAQQAFEQIRRLEEVASPAVSSVLRVDPEQSIGEQVSSLYEAVLHPRAVRSGEPVAIDAATLDRWVSLVESYGGTVHGDFLRTVGGLTFVPVRVADADAPQLDRVLRRADQIARTSVWRSSQPRHLVITGAPGTGKSTLAQYLTQLYRAQFAAREANEASITTLIGRTEKSLQRIGVAPPASPRWPLRVELAKMAAEMGPAGGPNLKRWLADRATERAGLDIQPATLDAWIKAWPTLLVFDGLDEVTAPALRHRVIDRSPG